jgi:PIN domain nuclease of toxin-antitoxin system
MIGVYLLDTSALLSFIEDEEGADRVEIALKQK